MAETGAGFEEALDEATALGYAEADPTADVEGFDAAAKAAILAVARVPHAGSPPPTSTARASRVHRGRLRLRPTRIGYVVKLLAICERARQDGAASVPVRVHPAMVPPSTRSPASAVRTTRSSSRPRRRAADVLRPRRRRCSRPRSAVLGDLVAVARNRVAGWRGPGESRLRRACPSGRMARDVTRYHVASTSPTARACWPGGRSLRRARRVASRHVRQNGQGDDAHLVIVTHARPRAALRAPSRRCGTCLDVVGVSSSVCGRGSLMTARSGRRRPWLAGVIEAYRDRLPVTDDARRWSRSARAARRSSRRRRCRERTGCEVRLKVEGANPTGSFKDRGMTMAISKAVEEGAKAVICASTGNTSACAAAYAARAGHDLRRARPAGQDRAGQAGPGARARRPAAPGRRQLRRLPRAGPQARRATTRSRWSTRSTRTGSRARRRPPFEIVDALGDAPDIHCLPVGNAGNITAYWKGYREYATTAGGRRPRRPRMWGFQAAGAAPIVRGEPSSSPRPIATAIRIGNPASWQQAARRARRVRRPHRGGHRPSRSSPRYRLLAAQRASSSSPRRRPSVAGLLQARRGRRLEPGPADRLHRHRPRPQGPAVGVCGRRPAATSSRSDAGVGRRRRLGLD